MAFKVKKKGGTKNQIDALIKDISKITKQVEKISKKQQGGSGGWWRKYQRYKQIKSIINPAIPVKSMIS